ncbi:MAG: hypothetical protein BRD40_00715 [Bacteroidetes bacterium QS_1_65_9]|nr:MAG: hypothetical protein BRD40_00715 [Bacteroidetes bacterium QS_1_65_9]
MDVGADYAVDDLRRDFNAVVLCNGATAPRDLPVPGHDLEGVHFAWDYLHRHNKRVAGDDLASEQFDDISAEGKHVIVIGGGDTGSDCVGTTNRQQPASVTQFELMPTPPDERPPDQPWPYMPMVLKTTSSHEEGVDRQWSILTKEFLGSNGRVEKLRTRSDGRRAGRAPHHRHGRRLHDERRGRLCGGRRATRAVAHRVGHLRGPRGRA